MTAAWLAYIPVPGVAIACARSAPHDRLVRFHARQGNLLVLFGYAMLALLGLLATAAPATKPAVSVAAGLLLAAVLVGLLAGGIGAARRRFTRIRPLWDLISR
ncbi:MAG: hypothetical protein V4510_07830 [bacterium]